MENTMKPANEDHAVMAKHGQALLTLVLSRKRELEQELIELNEAPAEVRADIDAALAALKGLLTGNLDQIPPVVAQELSQWIATSKYLAKPEEVAQPVRTLVAKSGQPLRAVVEARCRELELELGEIKRGAPGTATDLEAAVSALKALMTGNLDYIPFVVAQELSLWIDSSRYLGTKARRTRTT